jgi:KUP system potassium uptake protein
MVGAALFIIMNTWIKGRKLLAKHMDEQKVMFEELEQNLKIKQLAIVPGTAIYLAKNLHGVPSVLLHNLAHNHVVHEQMIVLTIVTKDEPYVEESQRLKIRVFGESNNFYRIKMYFGFHEEPDMRRALQLCQHEGLVIDPKTVSFFVGDEEILFRRRTPLAKWRRALFRFLFHNASSAIEYFKIPVENVIKIGIRIEL